MGTAKMSGTELTVNMDVRIVSRSSLRAAERLTESVGFRPPVILMSRIDQAFERLGAGNAPYHIVPYVDF